MKKSFQFFAGLLIILILSSSSSNSQGFDYLKKTRETLNRDKSKIPTDQQLEKLSIKLSNYYFTNNLGKISEDDFQSSNTGFRTLNLSQSDLMKKSSEFGLGNVQFSNQGLPLFVTLPEVGNKKHTLKFLTKENILDYIKENKSLFKIENPDKEFKLNSASTDNEGNNHFKMQQYIDDVPFWGKEIILHFNKNNELYMVNGRYSETLKNHSIIEKINSNEAVGIAENHIRKVIENEVLDNKTKKLLNYDGPKAEKYYWQKDDKSAIRLVWMVEIRPNIIDNYRYFIDAQTGEILEKYNSSPADGAVKATAKDALGNNRTFNVYLENGIYYMIDATKPMYNNNPSNPKGIILTMSNNYQDLTQSSNPGTVTSNNNQWNDAFSVSAHYNTALIYDYYKNTHNRSSCDDKGMNMLVIIHVTDQGQSFDNAYWNGQFVVLGDGGQMTKGWPPALDFTAHEFTHGVVTFTVDLEYKNQSGALNEAFADWGGCMVDRDDWKMGEDIVRTELFPSGCMRSLENPHNGGTKGDHIWLPAHMNEFMNLSLDQDNGGVHYNCGIINRATFLIGNSIGKDKLEKIYYRVLNNKYLTKQAEFIDMRLACVKAAEELFGKNTNEVNVVKSSFDQVGITDGSGSTPDPDLPSVQGTEWIAFISAIDFSLNMAKPVIQNQATDIKKLTSTAVNAQNNGTITVPERGNAVIFIDNNHNLKGINTNGSSEAFIDNSGAWRSLAISPNGQYLAVTTVVEQPIIYIFDLKNSSYKQIELYTPSTGDDFSYNEPLLANTMSWDVTNKILVYDALNYKFNWEGEDEYYMDMNAIDYASGVIYRIFPNMGSGISIGSPDFGKTSSRVLTFLVYDDNDKVYYINGVDLYSGTIKNILYANANEFNISSPVYSVKDNKLAFQISDAKPTYAIMQIPLGTDKISAAGDPADYLINVGIPKWFAIGTRPSDISDESTIESFEISPNPAQDYIAIDIKPAEGLQSAEGSGINIYNSFGELVLADFNHLQNVGNLGRIDISHLPVGLYFIKIGNKVERFVKM